MNEKLEATYNAILNGDMAATNAAVQSALDDGLDPGLILSDGMIFRYEAGWKVF